MFATHTLLTALSWAAIATAHTVITYPGWRGNNLHTNGTLPQYDPGALGINEEGNGTHTYPYGMQWMYPCGGMPMSRNRTLWPFQGGAVSIQPGWFPGHSKAFFYVNIGIQAYGELAPPNYSHPVVPPFQIVGPSNLEYPGQFCLPQVPMPTNVSLQVGDNITLQVIETAQHGASLYNCVDLTLAHPSEVEQVTPDNCYNSSDLEFNLVFTTESLQSGALSVKSGSTAALPFVLLASMAMLLL